jgi:hypothetical protein
MLKKPNTKPQKSDRDRRLKLRNMTSKFDTWNVEGCGNIMEEINKGSIMKMDVVVITETKNKGTEVKHWKIIYTFTAG